MIESEEELSHDGSESDFVRFAVAAQTLIEVAQDQVVPSSHQCGERALSSGRQAIRANRAANTMPNVRSELFGPASAAVVFGSSAVAIAQSLSSR